MEQSASFFYKTNDISENIIKTKQPEKDCFKLETDSNKLYDIYKKNVSLGET